MNSPKPYFSGFDHLAIAVPNTEEALKTWRDTYGFPVVCSEAVNDGTVRLTHLDMGNAHLQLVEPLTPDHPLQEWLKKNGPGLHHFCMRVDNVQHSFETLPESGISTAPGVHQGTQGKKALFLNKEQSQNIQVEVTGP
ncbi:VOC family protein [Puniceicoccaceae bacterium K14]|nr:VOC family protein [Puniceicoccaceae bacterium K14]